LFFPSYRVFIIKGIIIYKTLIINKLTKNPLMNQSNDNQWARCPAGYFVRLADEEKINESNMNQRSKIRNQLKKDRLTGFLFVLVFIMVLLVSLV